MYWWKAWHGTNSVRASCLSGNDEVKKSADKNVCPVGDSTGTGKTTAVTM